jgi:hypothetical protein
MKITIGGTHMWVDGNLPGGFLMLTLQRIGFDGALSCHLEAVGGSTRRDAFSGRMLVLRMYHGRQRQDGVSLAGADSKEVRLCSDRSQTSFDDCAC